MTLVMRTDVDLQRDVNDELAYDPEIDAADIGVTVDDGVVTLAGTVKHFVQYSAADRAVRRVAHVRAIANDIKVATAFGHMSNDTEIAKGIADAFDRHVLIPPEITIRVTDGGVKLEGTVAWDYQRNAAEATARSVHGVRWAWNLITVIQPAVDAAMIEQGISQALVRHAIVDAQHVHVAVSGHLVTLTGEVSSLAEYHEAGAAAWRSTGVTGITNHLRVSPHSIR